MTGYQRIIRSVWMGSLALGLSVFFLLSLINDVAVMMPLWARVIGGIGAALVIRWGFILDQRKLAVCYPAQR